MKFILWWVPWFQSEYVRLAPALGRHNGPDPDLGPRRGRPWFRPLRHRTRFRQVGPRIRRYVHCTVPIDIGFSIVFTVQSGMVADPHNCHADPEPDPSFHLNADPDPTFYFNAYQDPDPAPPEWCESAVTGTVYRLSKPPFGSYKLPFWGYIPPFWASKAPEFWLQCGSGSNFSLFSSCTVVHPH